MNENINLCEILKDCPKGTRLWSPIFGDVKFETLSEKETEEGIWVPTSVVVGDGHGSFWFFTPNGYPNISGVITREVMLFPSKDCRDWSKWKCPKPFEPKRPKFDPKTLKPFDRVLVWEDGYGNGFWATAVFSHLIQEDILTAYCGGIFIRVIPYNNETKHLVGTADEAPEHYRYWKN